MRKIYTSKIKRFGFFAFVLSALFSLTNVSDVLGQSQTVTITSTGAGTWTAPCGVTSITVEAWGGGGSGGGSTSNNIKGGGGGAGGTYVSSILSVTPGTTYNLNVGSGATGTQGAGSKGGSSWFNSMTTLLAPGGNGGAAPNGGTVAGGAGSTAGSIGTTQVAGISGSSGTSSVGGAGGTGGNSGGTGGSQRTNEGDGNNGSQPGGGGAGAFVSDNSNHNGGAGGDGQIVITYNGLPSYCTPSFSSGVAPITNVTFAGINKNSSNSTSSPQYEAFCDASGSVVQGSTYPISVTWAGYSSSYFYVRVYIDWNQNGVLGDVSNEIYDVGRSAGAGTITNNISVPAGAKLGSTIMRVTNNYNGYITSACSSANYGQAEDYTLTVTSPCTVPSITTQPVSQTICPGGNVTFSVAASGTAPFTYQWKKGSSNITGATNSSYTITGVGGGDAANYSVVVTNSCGNVTSSNATLTLGTAPSISGQPSGTDRPYCLNASATALSVTAGGTGTLTYQWYKNSTPSNSGGTSMGTTNGAQTATFTPPTNAAGTTYYYYVVVSGTCGTATSNVSGAITVNPLPATTTVSGAGTYCVSTIITANNGSDGTIYFQGTTPNGTSTATPSTSQTITTSGTYYFRAISASGCWGAQGSAVVTINPLPTALISGTATVCEGSAGTITFTGASATSPYTFTYSVNGGTNQTVSTSTSSSTATVASPTSNGVYMYNLVSVSDKNGCSQNQTGLATVTVNPTPTATISGDATVCKDDASPLITFTNPMALPVTVSYNINGSGSYTLNVGANATATVAAPTNAANTFAYNLVSVAYQSTPGCSNNITGTATVIVRPTPVATITGTTTVCQNDGSPGVTFTNPQNLPITVTYHINSESTSTINVDASSTATVNAPTGIDGVFVYTIDNVVYQSGPNCSNGITGQTATITVRPTPTVTISGEAVVCQNAPQPVVTFTNPMLLPVTVTYNINGSGNATIDVPANGTATKVAVTTAAGVFVYNLVSVQYQTGPNCPNPITGSTTITVNPLPTATISADQTVCKDQATNVTFTGANGTAPYTFTYSINAVTQPTVTSTGNSIDVPVNTGTPGQVIYTLLSVQDGSSTACSNAATGTSTITVKTPPSITTDIDVAHMTYCATFPVDISVTAAGDGLTYQWYKNGTAVSNIPNVISGANSATLHFNHVQVSDEGDYYVVVSGLSSCTPAKSSTGYLTVNQQITINTQPQPVAICTNGTATFSIDASGAGEVLSYQWRKGGTPLSDGTGISGSLTSLLTISNATVAQSATNYNVIVTTTVPGCTQALSDDVTLIVNPTPTVNAVENKVICNNAPSGAISFSGGVSGVEYNWTNDNTSIGLAASGTGTINSFTATNATDAPITATITVTPTYTNTGTPSETCYGTPITFTITVNPTATVDAISDQVKCNGSATDAIHFTSPNTGGSIVYNWTNSASSIGLAASGTGDISSFTALNNGTDPVVATITVMPSFTNGNTCAGTASTFKITVNPTPKLSSSLTPPAICNNTTFSYTPTSATSGVSFDWSRAVVPGISNGAANGSGNPNEALVNTTADPISVVYVYTLKLSDGSCPNTQNVTVIVNPTPVLSSTLTPDAVCSNSPFAYTPTSETGGTTFSWSRAAVAGISNTASNGIGNINETLINTSGAPVPVTYVYTLTANGCNNTQSVVVTVNPTVTIAPLTQDTVCNNAQIIPIGISGLPAGSLTWSYTPQAGLTSTIPTSGSGTISGVFSNTTVGVKTVTFTINAVSSYSCPSTATATVIVRDSLKAPVIDATQVLCPGSSPTPLTIEPGTGSGTLGVNPYKWIRSSNGNTGWSVVGTGTSYTPPATSYYYALVVSNPCESDTSNIVQISTANDFEAGISFKNSVPSTLCSGESFPISLLSLDIRGSILGDKKIRFDWKSVEPDFFTSSTINPFGETHDLWLIFWTVYWFTGDADFTVHNSTSAPLTKDLSITPVVLNPNNSLFCNLSPKIVTITINPVPVITDRTATICSGGTFSVTPANGSPSGNIVPSGTLYSWTAPSVAGITGTVGGTNQSSVNTGTLVNTTNLPINVTYEVYPKVGTNGCTGNPFNVTVTVNPAPKITTPQTQTICSGDQFVITPADGSGNIIPSGTIYTWSKPAAITGIGGLAAGSNQNNISGTLTNSTNLPVNVTYSVTATSGTCSGDNFDVTITVNPSAAITSVTGGTSPLCIGATTKVTANGVVLGGSGIGVWSSDNTGAATVDNTGNVTAVGEGTAKIIYTITGGCGGTVFAQQSITVSPNAAVSSVSGTDDPLCIGSTTTFTAGGVILGNGTGSWSSSDNNIATVSASGVVTAVGEGTANITYTINGGCNGTPSASHSITVNKDANPGTLSANGATTLCIGSTVTFTSTGGDAGAWSSDNTGVATVDPSTGVVTAVSKGTANIIYTVSTGCNQPKSVSSSVTVSGNANAGTISGYSGNPLCATSTLLLSTSGDDGGTWTSDNPSVATVNTSSGLVTAVSHGTAHITYTIPYNASVCGTPVSAPSVEISVIDAGTSLVAGPITGPTGNICANTDGFTFSIAAVNDAISYDWTLPSDWSITASDHTNSITVKTGISSGTVLVNAKNGCPFATPSSPLTVALHNVWAGTNTSEWNTGSNWADGHVADAGCGDVYIPSTSNQPILGSGSAAVGNLHILPGAILTVNNATMQISGAIDKDNLGTFDVTHGTLNFNGAAPQTIEGIMFANKTVENLKVSNDALNISATGDTLNITGVVSFGTGTAQLNTGGNLTLKSTKDNTASIGELASGNAVTGQVEVERYINIGPGGHAKTWQFLATPTGSDGHGQSLKYSWMEGGIKPTIPNGYGAQFTGTTGTTGYDGSSPAPSVKFWNENTGNWAEFANTTDLLYNSRGYFAFIRGDRSVSSPSAPAVPTTLRSKGVIITGTKSFTVPKQTDNVFFSIGNPYPSAVDMTKVQQTGSSGTPPDPHLQFIYVWNPLLNEGYGVGGWNTLTWNGTHYVSIPDYTQNDMIQSGQAFLVQEDPLNTTTVTFTENTKSASSSNIAFKGQAVAGKAAELVTNLFALKADSNAVLTDGTLQMFDKSYTNKIDRYDARKIMNSANNLSVKTSGVNLVVERRAPLTEQDTIQYNMANMTAQNYRLEFKAQGLSSEGVEGFVEDTYLNTRTPLNLEGATNVDFAVTNDKGSYAANRFRIVFASRPPVEVALAFISLEAHQQDADIAVSWKVKNEKGMKQYEVEKSMDGVNFTKAATVTATNSGIGSYQWTDKQVTPGDNYYRIRCVGMDGRISYSTVVKVTVVYENPSISIHPNPITDGIIHLQFINQPQGRYGIRLMNSLGQVIVSKQVEHAAGNATENIQWSYYLARGVYQLEVTRPDGSVKIIKVLY